MAEKIPLAEFDIDIDAVLANLQQLRGAIDELKAVQSQARKEGKANTEAYEANEIALKTLSKEYSQNQQAVVALTTATGLNNKASGEAVDRAQLLAAALDIEAKSIAEAREQNKLLNKLRNEANAATAEGQAEIKRLNEALDSNNAFIKDNSDALTQQKMNVGNYTESIQKAFSVQSLMTGGLAGLKTALTGAAQGFMAMTKASLTFLATPIGAVIGALGLVLGIVINAFKNTQEGMDIVTAVTRPLVAIFEVFIGVIQDLGLLLIDAFSNPLETIEKIYNY